MAESGLECLDKPEPVGATRGRSISVQGADAEVLRLVPIVSEPGEVDVILPRSSSFKIVVESIEERRAGKVLLRSSHEIRISHGPSHAADPQRDRLRRVGLSGNLV